MTDYKRMVSYMYQYDNGVKKKNVGYARVEAKNGQCKLTIHMQLLGQSDSIFPTYLIHRDDNRLDLVYLGDSILKTQVMDSRLTANESNIMESGYSLRDMSGILIFLNNNIFFATVWDEKVLNLDELLEAMKPKQKRNERNEKQDTYAEPAISTMNSAIKNNSIEQKEAIKTEEPQDFEDKLSLEEELKIPAYRFPRGLKTIEMFRRSIAIADKIYGSDESSKTDMDKIEDQMPPDMTEVSRQETSADNSNEQKDEQINDMSNDQGESPLSDAGAETEDIRNEDHDSIFGQFNRLYPFEDNEILLCVKIEPKDIGILPKEMWSLSSNSFLLHGYYCYHHLILAKMKYKETAIYILGVPGLFQNREQFMARMFGFDSFKSIKKRELRSGDFGYWYRQINW